MNPSVPEFTIKRTLQTMTILHICFCISTLVFGIVATVIAENRQIVFFEENDELFYIIPALAIIAPVVGLYIYNKLLKQVKQKPSLKQKLINYQSARLIRYAFIEAPAMFAIVGFLITNNIVYLILASILLVYLVSLRPTKNSLKDDLNLNAQDARALRDALN